MSHQVVYRNYACALKNQVVDSNKKRHADTHKLNKIQYKKRYQFDEAVKNYFVLPHQWNEPIATLTQEIQSKDKNLSDNVDDFKKSCYKCSDCFMIFFIASAKSKHKKKYI